MHNPKQMVVLVAWLAVTAFAQPVAADDALLVRFDADFDVSALKLKNATADAASDGKGLLVQLDQAKESSVMIQNTDHAWDAGDANALAIEWTNRGNEAITVHGRVDGPGPWGKAPSNSAMKRLAPGETGRIVVRFGKRYGKDVEAVQPDQIDKVLLFVPNTRGDEAFVINALYGTTFETDTTAGGHTVGSTDTNVPGFKPAIDGVLFDFDRTYDADRVKPERTTFELVDGGSGKAMKATYPANANYPGMRFMAPDGAWDLSDFGGISMDVTNAGNEAVRLFLRVDNAGDPADKPWNSSGPVKVEAGETVTVKTHFGKNGHSDGYPLNAARVISTLLFMGKLSSPATLLIDNVQAFGSPAPQSSMAVPLSGEVEDFGAGFDVATRTNTQGCEVRRGSEQLLVAFDNTRKWPALTISAPGKNWDLSNFESLQVSLTNIGDAPVKTGVRVDNPGADGKNNCNTESLTLQPGESRTVTVTFGQSWGQPGFALDTSNVVAVQIIGPSNTEASLAVGAIRAQPKPYADLPTWLGERPPVEGDWVVTLDEAFDGPSLNESVWTTEMRGGGLLEGELQAYSPRNLSFRDGNLVFLCEKRTAHQYDDPARPTRDYATAVIQSFDKFTQRYGYFEARFKPATARGLWPAFWLMPDRGPEGGDKWQRGATGGEGMEIDIYEYLTEWGPGRYNVAAHWDGYGADHKSWGSSHLYHLPTTDGFHTYGVLWEPGRLIFYCDGKQMAEFENPRVGSTPMFMILNVQTGRWATKDIDDAALPDEWVVDYVRVWQTRDRL